MPNAPQSIVYLPGLGEGRIGAGIIDQTPDGIASRLVDALNRRVGSSEYAVLGEGREEEYTKDCTTSIRTITRISAEGQPETAYTFYQFHYNRNMTGPFEKYGILWKLVVLAMTLISCIPLTKALFRKKSGKTLAERFQFLYAACILSMLCIYLFILAWALVDQTFTLFQIKIGTLPSSGSEWFDNRTHDFVRFIGWLAVLLTFVGLTWSSLTTKLSQAATFYLCATNYLQHGDRRATLTGQFCKLLEFIDSKNRGGEIHVIGYSFGSVVAIDSLFSGTEPPKIMLRVKSFVSIGCPFDMIRTYWPGYFHRRQSAKAPLWINVYSVRDLLGSNFRNDSEVGAPNVGILVDSSNIMSPKNLEYQITFAAADDEIEKKRSMVAALLFVGFRFHTSYWGEVYEGEMTCFSLFIDEVFFPPAPPPPVAPAQPAATHLGEPATSDSGASRSEQR